MSGYRAGRTPTTGHEQGLLRFLMKVLIFGLGFTGTTLARRLAARDIAVVGTRRSPDKTETRWQELPFDGGTPSAAVTEAAKRATHVVLSIPPDSDGDPVIRHLSDTLGANKDLKWLGYLSTIGVYGDLGGDVATEATPVKPQSARAHRRVLAENQVWAWAERYKKGTSIFRLPGIYGPGRSQLDALQEGTARRVVKPGQVFNRIHVEDIARALEAALTTAPLAKLYNLTDGNPAPPDEVIEYAAGLLGVPPPPAIAFDPAKLPPMTVEFYSECKRIDSSLIWNDLWLEPLYPTYREGLADIHRASARTTP
jgi:nucleoside-diphosphate-sugar epimerase